MVINYLLKMHRLGAAAPGELPAELCIHYLRAVGRKVLWSSACVCVSVRTRGGRAGGVRTLLQPARAQCLRLSERFFHSVIVVQLTTDNDRSKRSEVEVE